MKYFILADAYEKIEATTKRLEIRDLLAELFRKTPKDVVEKIVYLTQGKLYPDYVGIELGMAERLMVKAIALASGKTEKTVETSFRATGDLGETAEKLLGGRTQQTLSEKILSVEDVYKALIRSPEQQGRDLLKQRLDSSAIS